MMTAGSNSISIIRSQKFERKTDSLSIGISSPPTGVGGGGLVGTTPLSVGPGLTARASTRAYLCRLLKFVSSPIDRKVDLYGLGIKVFPESNSNERLKSLEYSPKLAMVKAYWTPYG